MTAPTSGRRGKLTVLALFLLLCLFALGFWVAVKRSAPGLRRADAPANEEKP